MLLESLIIRVHVTLQHPIQKLSHNDDASPFHFLLKLVTIQMVNNIWDKVSKKFIMCYLLLYINIMYYA